MSRGFVGELEIGRGRKERRGETKDSPDELPGEPQERLLEVVVRLGRDLEVLEVLLSVEGDGSGLDLSLLFEGKGRTRGRRRRKERSARGSFPSFRATVPNPTTSHLSKT